MTHACTTRQMKIWLTRQSWLTRQTCLTHPNAYMHNTTNQNLTDVDHRTRRGGKLHPGYEHWRFPSTEARAAFFTRHHTPATPTIPLPSGCCTLDPMVSPAACDAATARLRHSPVDTVDVIGSLDPSAALALVTTGDTTASREVCCLPVALS